MCHYIWQWVSAAALVWITPKCTPIYWLLTWTIWTIEATWTIEFLPSGWINGNNLLFIGIFSCCACGTGHMASLFTSLSRTAIATFFSEAVLQTCQHQLPQALTATTALCKMMTSLQEGPLSRNLLRFSCHLWCTSHNLRASSKSIRCNSHLMNTPALLGKPHGNLGTNYYATNKLLARNSTSNTQRTIPKVPEPHQGCSTAHRGSEGTNNSTSASSCHRCWCSSRDLHPFCQVHSHRSSRHYHSAMTVAKQAWHDHLPYKPNAFSNSYQQ